LSCAVAWTTMRSTADAMGVLQKLVDVHGQCMYMAGARQAR
jgi:hypothetical protein